MIRKGGPITGWVGLTLLYAAILTSLYAFYVSMAAVIGLLSWLSKGHPGTFLHNFISDVQVGFWFCTITCLVVAVGYAVGSVAKRIARFLIEKKWLMRCGVLGEALNAALTVLTERN